MKKTEKKANINHKKVLSTLNVQAQKLMNLVWGL